MQDLQNKVAAFAAERDWQQFHNPKNLAMALSVEASELVEIFQWMDPAEADNLTGEDRQRVAQELADVLLYSLLMSERLGLDLHSAALEKLSLNERRYPVELAKGNSKKYDELAGQTP